MEYVVFVTPDGTPTGEIGEKLASHHQDTKMHLAFSCYIFNEHGQILVTQRASIKKVWPDVWTNSVCGHPAPDESLEEAITRRAAYELGMTVTDITPALPKYSYKTPPYNGIIEHEFCPVFFARATSNPEPNPDEVSHYKWLDWHDFLAATTTDTADVWSWWCKNQLKQLVLLKMLGNWTR